jgi:hypothetical protein
LRGPDVSTIMVWSSILYGGAKYLDKGLAPRYITAGMNHPIELEQPAFDGDTYYCVGGNPVRLKTRHDVRQLWFKFDDRPILFRSHEPEPAVMHPHNIPDAIRKRIKRKLVPMESMLQPYLVEEGVEQYPLPMERWQITSKSMTKKIKRNNYPCFERDETGEVLRLSYRGNGDARNDNAPLREWITRNCVGRVILDGASAIFEREDYSILALVSGNFSKF